MKRTISEIIQTNQITLSLALDKLKDIHKQLGVLHESLIFLIDGLDYFEIGKEDLKPGHFELGILIPTEAVDNKLLKLGNEFSEIEKILLVFSELAVGSRTSIQVNQISPSDFTLYLEIGAKMAACIALAIERIIALYKTLLEIKQLRSNIENLGVPKSKLSAVDEYANESMGNGIEKLASDLMGRFWKNRDEGRKNEVELELKKSLSKIANRIDKGYNIDIRVEPIGENEFEGDEKKKEELINYITEVKKLTQHLKYIKTDGRPILSLPENTSTAPPKPKKTTRKRK